MGASTVAIGADTDPELVGIVARAQDGDNAAFAEIYDRYVDMVFGYLFRKTGDRPTAEDLTSDVFLNAYRRLGTFSWQGRDLGAWIFTIARNRVRDHFKSARFNRTRPTDVTPESEDLSPHGSPEHVQLARDMALSLGRALGELKDDHREVLELRFVHEFSVAETAEVLDRSVGATKALQYRALKALAEVVKSEPDLATLSIGSLAAIISTLGRLTP